MYVPRPVPQNKEDWPSFLDQEHRNIASSQAEPQIFLSLAMQYREPGKLKDGMIVLADGTSWNPGNGPGYYGYRAGAWRFLG